MKLYDVVENKQYTYSNGMRKNESNVVCSFASKDSAKSFVRGQYWVLTNLDYESVAIGSDTYVKTRTFTKRDMLGEYELEEEEVLRYFISEKEV